MRFLPIYLAFLFSFACNSSKPTAPILEVGPEPVIRITGADTNYQEGEASAYHLALLRDSLYVPTDGSSNEIIYEGTIKNVSQLAIKGASVVVKAYEDGVAIGDGEDKLGIGSAGSNILPVGYEDPFFVTVQAYQIPTRYDSISVVFYVPTEGLNEIPFTEETPDSTVQDTTTVHPVLGVRVTPEVRHTEYDRDDYSYPASIELRIVDQQGGIFSPYSLACFDSTTATDIEHIVATSEAHESGMSLKTIEERTQYARDLDNLTLASPSLNRHQKSNKDPAEWMPENNRCWYAGKYVEIKKKYGLSMDQVEADSLLNVYESCTSYEMTIPGCATQQTS